MVKAQPSARQAAARLGRLPARQRHRHHLRRHPHRDTKRAAQRARPSASGLEEPTRSFGRHLDDGRRGPLRCRRRVAVPMPRVGSQGRAVVSIKRRVGPIRRSSPQLRQQRLCLFQIGRVEAFGEPTGTEAGAGGAVSATGIPATATELGRGLVLEAADRQGKSSGAPHSAQKRLVAALSAMQLRQRNSVLPSGAVASRRAGLNLQRP